MVMLVSLFLTDNSFFIFTDSSLVGIMPDSSTVEMFFITGNPGRISNGSSLTLQNCTIYSNCGTPVFILPTVSFSMSSYLTLTACNLTGDSFAFDILEALVFVNSSYLAITSSSLTAKWRALSIYSAVSFISSSNFVVSSCRITARGRGAGGGDGAFIMSSLATFNASSYFVVQSCTITGEGNVGKGFGIDSAVFASSSYFAVVSSTITGLIGFGMNSRNGITFHQLSSWEVTLSTFSSSLGTAFGFSDTSVALQQRSTWKISGCIFFGWLGFSGTSVQLIGGSFFGIVSTRFRVSSSIYFSGAVVFCSVFSAGNGNRSSLSLNDVSLVNISGCSFATSSASSIILFFIADVLIQNGSSFVVIDCTGESTGTGGSLVFSGSALTIQQSSELKILRSSFTAVSSAGLAFSSKSTVKVQHLSVFVIDNSTLQGSPCAIRSSTDSTIQLDDMSAFVISSSRLLATTMVQLQGLVSARGSSLFAMRVNTLQIAEGAAQSCVSLGALALSSRGVATLTDNNCTGPSDGAVFLSIAGGESAGLVVRCNTVNGAVWKPLLLEFIGISSLPCGRCDRAVDCFWPLTEPALFTRMVCDGGGDVVLQPHCPCITSCGGDVELMCLPGRGTTNLNAPSCLVGSVNTMPRLQTTRSVTECGTPTENITISVSQRNAQRSGREPKSVAALHSTTVAFASTAVFLSGPCGAGMMQRMQAHQQLNNCGEGGDGTVDFSSSPTRMHFGPAESSSVGSFHMDFVRGCVAGNLLLWLVCVAAACLLTTVAQVRKGSGGSSEAHGVLSWVAMATDLQLPGRLYWPYSMLSVPTLTSSTMLLVPIGGTQAPRPGDALLGVLGILVSLAAVGCAAYITTGRRFDATASSKFNSLHQLASCSPSAGAITRWSKRAVLEYASRWVWVDRVRAPGFVKRWGTLFSAYCKGQQWFVVVELAASALVAILAGLIPLDSGDGALCEYLQVLSALAAVAFLASVVVLRPYGSPMDERLAKINAGATAASSLFGVLGVDTTILTAAQAILNSVSALALVALRALDSTVFLSARHLFGQIAAGPEGGEGAHRSVQGKDEGFLWDRVSTSSRPLKSNAGRSAICLEMVQRMATGIPPSSTEKRRALEHIILLICETS